MPTRSFMRLPYSGRLIYVGRDRWAVHDKNNDFYPPAKIVENFDSSDALIDWMMECFPDIKWRGDPVPIVISKYWKFAREVGATTACRRLNARFGPRALRRNPPIRYVDQQKLSQMMGGVGMSITGRVAKQLVDAQKRKKGRD